MESRNKIKIVRHKPIQLIERVTITKFSVFKREWEVNPVYVSDQLSHAIYDIEIANTNALMMEKK